MAAGSEGGEEELREPSSSGGSEGEHQRPASQGGGSDGIIHGLCREAASEQQANLSEAGL